MAIMILLFLISIFVVVKSGSFNLANHAESQGIQVPLDMTTINLPTSSWTFELWAFIPNTNPQSNDISAVSAQSSSTDTAILKMKGKH